MTTRDGLYSQKQHNPRQELWAAFGRKTPEIGGSSKRSIPMGIRELESLMDAMVGFRHISDGIQQSNL